MDRRVRRDLVVAARERVGQSVGRFGLVLPPVYWGLAVLSRRRTVTAAVLALSAILLVAGTATLPLAFP